MVRVGVVASAQRQAEAPNVDAFLEDIGDALGDAGMPPMAARAFGALLCADDGSSTAAELATQLKASPAAISGAVHYLSQVGLVSRRRELGQRRERYSLDNDLWYEMFARRDQQLQRWIHILQHGIDTVGPATPAGQRLTHTQAFFAFLIEEIPQLLTRWREQGTGHDHRQHPSQPR